MATITFKNRNEQTCTITIDGVDGVFTGADTPFVTEENSQDDIFEPIVGQTGNIAVWAKPSDVLPLYASNPLDRAVTLKIGSATRWIGYLQCEGFTQPYSGIEEEISIPVVSPLGMLDSINIDQSSTDYISFANFILEMEEKLGNPHSQFVFPASMEAKTRLGYKFMRLNYLELLDHPDDNGNRYKAATYADVLKDICSFFGVQARESGLSLQFLALDTDTTKYHSFSRADLSALNTSDPIELNLSEVAESALTPATADHRFDIIPGRKEVKVTGKANERDKEVIALHLSDLDYKMNGNVIAEESTQNGGNCRYYIRHIKPSAHMELHTYELVDNSFVERENIENLKFQRRKEQDANKNYYGASVTEEALHDTGVTNSDNNYTRRLIIRSMSDGNHLSNAVTFRSEQISVGPKDMLLSLTANYQKVTGSGDPFRATGDFTLSAKIKYNGKWLRHSGTSSGVPNYGWGTTEQMVEIPMGNGGIRENVDMTNMQFFWNTKGFVIALPASTSGVLEISIVTNSNTQDFVGFTQFDVKIVDQYEQYHHDVDNVFLKKAGNYPDDWERECNLTTYDFNKRVDGMGIVVVNNISSFAGGNPEESLGRRAVAFFSKSHAKYTITSVDAYLRTNLAHYIINGERCIIGSQSMNWRDNELTNEYISIE